MIKLSTMISVCPDWSVEEIVDGMQRHGFQGLEPRVGWGHAAGIELNMAPGDREAVRQKLEDAGLAFSCVATGAKFALVDDGERAQSIEEARQAIDLAADLGAPVIRTFGGKRGGGQVYWMAGSPRSAPTKSLIPGKTFATRNLMASSSRVRRWKRSHSRMSPIGTS